MKSWVRLLVLVLLAAYPGPSAIAVAVAAQDPGQVQGAPQRLAGATVSADRINYKPGETAFIKGSGFLPGELVTLRVAHANGQNEGEAHLPFTTLSDDDGRIADQWVVPSTEAGNRVYALTAEGQASGLIALSSLTATEIFIIDDQGADDYPGQKDLNYFTFDYGLPGATSIALTWGWDDTSWSGNNSGDACVLFDTDADGKANFAYCVTVKGTPAVFVSSRMYSCGDTRSERCSQNTVIPTFTSTASAVVVAGSDPFGNAGPHFSAAHTSGNTCGAAPGCYTADTVATAVAQLADFGGSSAKLLNVCSYPSAEPNSAPSECVVTPNNGFLTIRKIAPANDATQFTFNIGAGQQSQSGATSWGINGTGQVSFISFPAGTTYDLSEVVPQGYALTGASCALQAAPPTQTGTFATTTISNFTIQSGLETICTFTNGFVPGSLIVSKQVVNNSGGTRIATDFSFRVNGGTAAAFLQDGADTLKGKNTISVEPGIYSVTEPGVTGYSTSYSNCTNLNIGPGATATCVITNDDQAATLIVEKLVVNSNGATGKATDFGFRVNGGTLTAFLQDGANVLRGKNTLTVNAGTYTVTETPPNGYSAAFSNCTNVVIANGGTATCTITNTDSKAAPGGSTVQRAVLHDSITVTGIRPGAGDASSAGAIFRMYSDAACATLVATESRPLAYNAAGTQGTASTSTGVPVVATGTYRWKVQYSGDAFNSGFTTACGVETTALTFQQ